jgi:WYL domain
MAGEGDRGQLSPLDAPTREGHPPVAPAGHLLEAGVWYLVARSGTQVVLTYKVASILGLTVLPHTFVRPEAFLLADFWCAQVERYERAVHRGSAVVRLSPRGDSGAAGVLGTRTSRPAGETIGPANIDSWHRPSWVARITDNRHGPRRGRLLSAQVDGGSATAKSPSVHLVIRIVGHFVVPCWRDHDYDPH